MKMNKDNKILITILVFVVVCVVGYALFSETITVTGTATAEGTFDVDVSCVTGFSQDYAEAINDNTIANYNQGGYKNDSCNASGFDVTFKTDLEYPGASRLYTIKVTNNGTIAARVPVSEAATERKESSACIINEDGTKSCSRLFILNNESGASTTFDQLDWHFFIKKPDGTYVTMLDETELMKYVDSDTEEVILEPGYSTYFMGQMDWPKEYSKDASGKQAANVELSVEYYFDITQAVK